MFNDIYKQSAIFEVKNQAFIFLDKYHKHIPLKTQLKTFDQLGLNTLIIGHIRIVYQNT
jgi:hypothetical protein